MSRTPSDAATAWTRLIIVLLARGLTATAIGLMFWAAAPMLIGWSSTTVMTGSMQPALIPGDVVVSMPSSNDELRPGRVLLYPDQEERLRLHRFAERSPDGSIITKGDANERADSVHINDRDVQGIGYLRVPVVGTPNLWAASGEGAKTALLLTVMLVIVGIAVLPATSDSSTTTKRRGRRRAQGGRSGTRPVTSAIAAVAAVLIVVSAVLPVIPAHAAFLATTTTPLSTFSMATAHPALSLRCSDRFDGTVSISWAYDGTAPQRFVALGDGTPINTVDATAREVIIGSNDLFRWRTTIITIRTDLTDTWTATTQTSVRVTTIRIFGIGRTSCAQ